MMCAPVVHSIASQTPDQITLTLNLPPALPCFAGHFPGFPVLPGVVQLDWVMQIARSFLACPPASGTDLRIKFKRPIAPGAALVLTVRHDAARHRLDFTYRSADTIASQGQVAPGTMSLRLCAIVPSYNHVRVVGDVVVKLRQLGLPVFVVDDGSDAPAAAALAALHDARHDVRVTRLPVNRGKGRAVCEGFRLAREAGFTHALQVDADGQHDLAAVPRMIDIARSHPDALVSGQAVFDGSAPLGRRIGRWITHVWVFVETLSFRITDSMCGLRVYPLAAVSAVVDAEPVGERMDFDTAVMVRLCWRGVPLVMVPVRVSYPPGNTSNFRLWQDNWRITCMHTRLVFAMLARLPIGRFSRPRPADATSAHSTSAHSTSASLEIGALDIGALGLAHRTWRGVRHPLLHCGVPAAWPPRLPHRHRADRRVFLPRRGRPPPCLARFPAACLCHRRH